MLGRADLWNRCRESLDTQAASSTLSRPSQSFAPLPLELALLCRLSSLASSSQSLSTSQPSSLRLKSFEMMLLS